MNPEVLVAGAEAQTGHELPVECEYIGHRKLRVSMTDRDAAALLGVAFAGRSEPARGDDLPSLVRRRSARVGLRKLLVARDRARVRFWNRVHVGHVALQDIEEAYPAKLGQERVYVSLTIEQAHAVWSFGESGRQRHLAALALLGKSPAAAKQPELGTGEAVERALAKLDTALQNAIRKHRETKTTREWFWSLCKDPLAWLPEKLAREKLRAATADSEA